MVQNRIFLCGRTRISAWSIEAYIGRALKNLNPSCLAHNAVSEASFLVPEPIAGIGVAAAAMMWATRKSTP